MSTAVRNASEVQRLNRRNCRMKPATCYASAEQKSKDSPWRSFLIDFICQGTIWYAHTNEIRCYGKDWTMRQSATIAHIILSLSLKMHGCLGTCTLVQHHVLPCQLYCTFRVTIIPWMASSPLTNLMLTSANLTTEWWEGLSGDDWWCTNTMQWSSACSHWGPTLHRVMSTCTADVFYSKQCDHCPLPIGTPPISTLGTSHLTVIILTQVVMRSVSGEGQWLHCLL